MTAVDRTEALKDALRDIKSLIRSIKSDCDKADTESILCSLQNAQEEAEAAIRALAERTEREEAREAMLDDIEYRRAVGF